MLQPGEGTQRQVGSAATRPGCVRERRPQACIPCCMSERAKYPTFDRRPPARAGITCSAWRGVRGCY
ncbi:hypothetical protein C0Q70_08737 [Pomacea canaliculata]|uniref:Uncharacterized protein n=1 Tax=Pomacea canaliculata TaxID=400727 RepID=A0A2T7P7X2_POMCA|nr:hypothetical protein C0Q70_08737 [Pomacea canaliculata]